MKISLKMHLLLVINVIMMIAVVGYGVTKMQIIGGELEEIAHEDIPLVESLTTITVDQLEQDIAMERALRAAGVNSHSQDRSKLVSEMHKRFDNLNVEINEFLLISEELAQKGINIAQTPEAKQEFEHVLQQLVKIEKEHKEYEHHVQEIFKLIESGRIAEAEKIALKAEHEAEQLNHELEILQKEIEKFTEQSMLRVEAEEHSAMVGMIAIAIASLVIGVSLGLWISTGIKNSLNKTNKVITDVAQNKDLSLRVEESKDELGEMGHHFNHMLSSIQTVVHQVAASSTQLAAASEEMSAVTNQSQAAVHTQKTETDQVATAMNEMSASMHEVALNASQAAEAVHNADTEIGASSGVVQEAVDAINHLASDVQEASAVIKELEEDSQNIGSVLEVIKDIAEQTNLLALNAAIEAARAGEQGRGFAVVADEVRTLAQRTQESTAQIQDTIERLQQRAEDAARVMEKGQDRALQGVDQAALAGQSLGSISNAVVVISDMAAQIASAAEEQSAVSEEINRSIVSISEVAGEVAVGAEQTDKASHDIAKLAVDLQTMASQFKA